MDEQERSDQPLSRRAWLKATIGGGTGLALGGLLDVPALKAASKEFKLANVSEFTTSCNFCSCGCGMIAAVRDGKLLTMEGDYDHIVNRGALCVKGISMFATHGRRAEHQRGVQLSQGGPAAGHVVRRAPGPTLT